MNITHMHKIIFLAVLWGIFLLMAFSLWRRSHDSKVKFRHLSPLYLVMINLIFVVSAVHFVGLYKQFMIPAIVSWVLSCVVTAVVFFIRSMRLEIEMDHKVDLVKVPMFFFKVLFWF